MKQYELIHDFFNMCGGDVPAKTDISTIETDDIEAWLGERIDMKAASVERQEMKSGAIVYTIDLAGMRERFIFSAC
ncbi:MAG: hypothetical protein FWF30_03805 [Coriobacteriia bacterium]|nr:hypothetical protein [Coriobacteriia bacterium]